MIINRCRPQHQPDEPHAAVPRPLRRPYHSQWIPSSIPLMTRCPPRRPSWSYLVNMPRAQFHGSVLPGTRSLLQRAVHPSSSARSAVKLSNQTYQIHLMKSKHCPVQREEDRDPSTARRISDTSCSMTRASSSKARACDISIFCQRHPNDNNFRSRQLRKKHETSATPRSVAGEDARTSSPRYFFRTDLSSPEGSTRRARHRGPRSCPD